MILPPPSLYTLHMVHLCSPEQQMINLYFLLSHQRAFQAREAVKIRLLDLDVLSVPGLQLSRTVVHGGLDKPKKVFQLDMRKAHSHPPSPDLFIGLIGPIGETTKWAKCRLLIWGRWAFLLWVSGFVPSLLVP